ncbi:MAG: response regulator [Candidatus Omnitrophica bacterium]|nr:response regulator [Candidatus Omnitrophota bacterium]
MQNIDRIKTRILIIEDNEMNRILEKDLLEQAGLEVLEAEDAESGLILARREKPDAIVMDLRLPDMLGIELAKILRQDKETGAIPIIFVTADIIGKNMNDLKASGFKEYVAKPIDTRTFVDQIKKYICRC